MNPTPQDTFAAAPRSQAAPPIRARRFRTQLFALATAVVLPMLLLIAVLLAGEFRSQFRQARETGLRLSLAAASEIHQRRDAAREVLMRVAVRPAVRRLDHSPCDPVFEDLSSLEPGFANMVLFDTSGNFVCSGLSPRPSRMTSEDMESVRRGLESHEPIFTPPFFESPSNRWVIGLTHAVRDNQGRAIGLLGVGLDLALERDVLERLRLPPGASASVVDAEGRYLARWPHQPLDIGKKFASGAGHQLRPGTRDSVLTAKGPDGVTRVYGMSTVEATGWRVLVGLPLDSVLAPLWRNLAVVGAAGLLSALLIAMLVMMLARRIERPVADLAAATRSAAAGQLGARASVSGPREIAEAARGFNQMLEARAAAESVMRLARADADAAREHVASVLERVTDGFVALDAQWNYIYVNQRGAELLGKRPEDLIGNHIWTVFPEGIGQPFYHAYLRAFEEQKIVELREFYRPWNRWFENRIYPSIDGLAIFFRDITDAVLAEESLRTTAARLEVAARASDVGFWELDLRTNTVYYSPEWKRQLGYEDHELANRYEEWESRLHPDDRERMLTQVQAYVVEPWPDYEAEFRMRHRDGSWRWILTRAGMLPDAAGKPASMFGCHVDITRHRRAEAERLELEAELSRNQHMSEIGSLVAGVAHEARNPLFAITASLDAFDARFGSRPEMAAYLQALRSSTSRLLRLMDGLLDYGRPRHPAIRALAVKSLFEEACRLSAPVAGAANVELQWANDSGCRVSVDQDQALQLLQNLIANAIQFSPAGGLVTLSARPVQSNGRDMVELEVRDHGPGFAPGDLPHLFEPFFTRREGGTGLGLPIVMRIAKAHGGDVIVRNAPDGGALVSVRLPAAADSAAAPSGPVTGSGARA